MKPMTTAAHCSSTHRVPLLPQALRPAAMGLASLSILLGMALLSGCKSSKDDHAAIGSKGLWIANGTDVLEYNPAQIGAGATATAPHATISSAAFGSPQGVAFDPSGNLWVLDPSAMINGKTMPALLEFSAAQLTALTTDNGPEPVAVITSSKMKTPRQAFIDTLGNAWVTDHDSGEVLVYAATQLAQTGTNTSDPVLVITSDQFNGPSGIAFDTAGNLWIGNNGIPQAANLEFGGGSTIVEITVDHVPGIPETGTTQLNIVSDATLSDEAQASIQSPWALAFDSLGNLYSSNSATSTVVRFAPSQLVTGSPVPDATISSTKEGSTASLDEPHGICIDDVNNVAVINEAGGSGGFGVAIFADRQLVSGASSPAPAAFISGQATMLHQPEGCAFGPVVK